MAYPASEEEERSLELSLRRAPPLELSPSIDLICPMCGRRDNGGYTLKKSFVGALCNGLNKSWSCERFLRGKTANVIVHELAALRGALVIRESAPLQNLLAHNPIILEEVRSFLFPRRVIYMGYHRHGATLGNSLVC